jgi:hypothetical protein
VDKVSKFYDNVALDIPEDDGQKTLGEAEKAYILWRKRYIIIPGRLLHREQTLGMYKS